MIVGTRAIAAMETITVRKVSGEAAPWPAILDLIRDAFAYMEHRIDPPSSALRLTAAEIAARADASAVFLAEAQSEPIGCVFCEPVGDALYLSKLAVRPERQGRGIGRALLAAVEAEARARGLPALELQTRVELTENHRAFRAMGFRTTARTSHPGFARPTSLKMRRDLPPPARA